jgi:hypothetical protein
MDFVRQFATCTSLEDITTFALGGGVLSSLPGDVSFANGVAKSNLSFSKARERHIVIILLEAQKYRHLGCR